MTTISETSAILIGGAGNGGQATQLDTNQIQQVYNNLITNGANAFSDSGSQTLIMTAGEIGQAGQIQSLANLETPQMVQQNQQTLNAIGAYCRSHEIGIQINAPLSMNLGYQAVDQWITAAAQAGLPIVEVNDVQEIGLYAEQSANPATFNYAPYAASEAASVKELISAYAMINPSYDVSKIAVGDMEPGVTTTWWNAYNSAAAAAGVSRISYVLQDMDWDVPWANGGQWQAALQTMVAATQSAGLVLDLDFQGMRTTVSGVQYVQQVEQYAAMVGTSGVSGCHISLESWQVNPTTMTAVNSPDSVANAAAEIAAILPLYSAGAINFRGAVSIFVRGQEVVQPGLLVSLPSITLQASPSTNLNAKTGVVLIDLYGTLSATRSGFGTVTQTAFNELTLTGSPTDLAAELSSVKICEPIAGPDTINIQTFGAVGQIGNTQIAILAVIKPQVTVNILPTARTQDWTQTSATLNAAGTILSETINWANTPTPASGGIGAIHTVAVHDPLAAYGVELVNGIVEDVYDPATDYDQGVSAFANYPTQNGQARTFAAAFDAAENTINVTVQSSTMTFDPNTGNLQTITSKLAPTAVSYVDAHNGKLVPDTFATSFLNGGSQVTEMNTGTNPDWQAGWGSQFASAILTYNSRGILVEEFLQGAAANPSFTLDDMFDPTTGAIWEQFQSNPQPSNYSNSITGTSFVTGSLNVTQYRVPGNPNWEYSDWGSTATVDTQVWLDYYLQTNMATPDLTVNSGWIDILNSPGTISIDLNALNSVVIDSISMSGPTSKVFGVDAWGATGPVSIIGLAAGGSSLIGGDYTTTITGSGNDLITAGSGRTNITTGRGGSSVKITSVTGTTTLFGNGNTIVAVFGSKLILNGTNNTVTSSTVTISLTAAGTATLSGNGNTITAVSGSKLVLNGTNNTITASNATISSASPNTRLTVIGNGDTITAAAGTTVTGTGAGDVVNIINGGTFYQSGTASSAVVSGSAVAVFMNTSGGTVTATGDGDWVAGGSRSIINLLGNKEVAVTGLGSIINISGQNDTASGNNMNVFVAGGTASVSGNGNQLTAGAGSTIGVGGTNNTVAVTASGVTLRNNSSSTLMVRVTAANAGVAVYGGGGGAILEITTGGTISLNSGDKYLTVKLDASAKLSLGKLSFIAVAGAAAGHCTITAGGQNQTLNGIGRNDTLIGSTSLGDTFLGTAAALSSDLIKNFGGNDVIDITDLSYASLKTLSYNALRGTLQCADASHNLQLSISGTLLSSGFGGASDGHGGTLVELTGH